MDSREISEWIAFSRIEPFGEERADLRAAIIACTMANAWRGKNQRQFRISDFLPKFDPPQKQSAEKITNILLGITCEK